MDIGWFPSGVGSDGMEVRVPAGAVGFFGRIDAGRLPIYQRLGASSAAASVEHHTSFPRWSGGAVDTNGSARPSAEVGRRR